MVIVLCCYCWTWRLSRHCWSMGIIVLFVQGRVWKRGWEQDLHDFYAISNYKRSLREDKNGICAHTNPRRGHRTYDSEEESVSLDLNSMLMRSWPTAASVHATCNAHPSRPDIFQNPGNQQKLSSFTSQLSQFGTGTPPQSRPFLFFLFLFFFNIRICIFKRSGIFKFVAIRSLHAHTSCKKLVRRSWALPHWAAPITAINRSRSSPILLPFGNDRSFSKCKWLVQETWAAVSAE